MNYYTIRITEDHEEREQNIGLGWSLPSEGIENFDLVESLGLFDCEFSEEDVSGDGYIEFVFSAGNWIHIDCSDFRKMLKECDLEFVVKYENDYGEKTYKVA